MKIVLAPNAFKESLTAREAADAMARGFARAVPEAELVLLPVADGGDGTVEVLLEARGGHSGSVTVMGPAGDPAEARLVELNDGTAVIEMAETSGLALVHPGLRDPMFTTTYGLGEMIKLALKQGARRVIIGIGGSATVDGGAGVLQALGFRLLDESGQPLRRGGGALVELARIEPSKFWNEHCNQADLYVACDVTNPLLGPEGAVAVFGPQKGATAETMPILEAGLANLAACIERDLGPADVGPLADFPGGGAAGGVNLALAGCLGARIMSGADLVLDTLGFERALEEADLVVTGEGRLDRQTLENKGPMVVARRAKMAGVPVIAIAGSVDPELTDHPELLRKAGITAAKGLLRGELTIEECKSRASELIEQAAVEFVAALGMNRGG